MNVVVDNLLTHYETTGEGQIVLLLHGWGDSLKGLAGLQKALAPNFKVVSLDLPGFGSTQPPKKVWGLDEYGAFVDDFLTKIDVQPYAVIGHSNGGALAIRSVARTIVTPQKLILLAASGIRNRNSGKRTALKVIAKTGNVATFWLPKNTRQRLRKKLYGAAGSDLLVMEHLEETFKKTVRQDVQADAAAISIPTLLIFADQDKAVPIADAHTYQRLIKGSQLEVVQGAGHFLHLEQPQLVADLMIEFLK